jgi:hypothetical protein
MTRLVRLDRGQQTRKGVRVCGRPGVGIRQAVLAELRQCRVGVRCSVIGNIQSVQAVHADESEMASLSWGLRKRSCYDLAGRHAVKTE